MCQAHDVPSCCHFQKWRSVTSEVTFNHFRSRLQQAFLEGHTVAQKSPCEENRVIMGQESPIKLGQRGQDARQEVPMRTPKPLYAQKRII